MTIRLNGEERDLPEALTLTALLDEIGLGGQPVLVERNGEPVHQRELDATVLADGDVIELIRVVAGG